MQFCLLTVFSVETGKLGVHFSLACRQHFMLQCLASFLPFDAYCIILTIITYFTSA